MTEILNKKKFPDSFIWGVSTSSYQIEGAAYEDGKGLSIWDDFCKKPGAIWNGHNGDIACDHYHLFEDDIRLMIDLGLNAYRFSISWPRILPNGTGKVNEKGINFYNSLIDALINANIEPHLTLYHWDLPLELSKKGGWSNKSCIEWFAEYTKIAVNAFSDRVKFWYPINEPQCIISLGYYQGNYAPGLKLPFKQALQAGHYLLMANGMSSLIIRQESKQKVSIGYSVASQIRVPASGKREDIEAAREAMHGVEPDNLWNNSWWMDPVYLGHYPEAGLKAYAEHLPEIGSDDMKMIHQPMDFCCNNVYTGKRVRTGKDGCPEVLPPPPGYNITMQEDWEVLPASIFWTSKWMYERYNLPIMITENGHQNLDFVHMDAKVHDPQRIDYMHRHLLDLKKAIDEGIPVTGYFTWTLLDNFEWAWGYRVRVGLVFTDFQSLKRIPKDSFYWYQKVIHSNELPDV